MDLIEYVQKHTARGECKCGRCIDKGNKSDPEGHVADLMFFKISAKDEPTAEEFTKLAKAHQGEFEKVDPFDGEEHSYLQLGAWIGDQGLAMQFMGLGHLLGVFDLLTPRTMLPPDVADEMGMQLAESGMVTVKKRR